MSVSLPRHRIRLALDAASHAAVKCEIQKRLPIIWRGTDAQVEVAFFWSAALITTVTNIGNVVLEIFDDDARDSAPLFTQTIAAGSIKSDLTTALWSGGLEASCHAKFTLANADTQLDMTDAVNHQRTFFLVVHSVTTDATPRYITWGRTQLTVEEDGAQNGLSVVPAPDPSVRYKSGNIQLYNPTTGKFHTLYCDGPAGAVAGVFDQTGEV